ncbi:SMI1/KNR4 family protein [Paenibacillus sp. FSL R5-0912]|uniref:SMI1/KNR4 family protein n=1 Tax=Paenibacillus sp. FSL R5-0912 TaxID=1536771 RepID=UPI000694AEC9|nr:SMI1/KNR4 family protein [Paenibacillus sp. FSL R5-0912]
MESSIRNEIINLLTKLGVEKSSIITDNSRSQALLEFEKRYAFTFPEEYKEFLLSFDEVFFDNMIVFKPVEASPLTKSDGQQYFDGFYGLDGLSEQIESYEERIPHNLIPIGECPGGNLICLGVKDATIGKIYFWNHENEFTAKLILGKDSGINDIDNYWDNMYCAANGFIEFLINMNISQDTIESGDIGDVEIWLDDDLLKD